MKTVGGGLFRVGLVAGVVVCVVSFFRRGPARRPVETAALGILRPPGALEEEAFLASCIRCNLCRDSCETQCIRLFGPSEGRVAGTPHIVAHERGCNLCMLCTIVCPTGALQELGEKKQVRMGTAVVDKRLCVSHNGTGACGACHTICPFKNKAIKQGLYNRPEVITEHCTGCGMCEEVCIVDDRRAIRVVTQRAWS
jgi:MauM/NapG family ferredoxin protein